MNLINISSIAVILIALSAPQIESVLRPWNINFENFTSIPSDHSDDQVDPGEPLFLTPLIQGGQLDEARNKSSVSNKAFNNTQSYSGYLTVNKVHKTNLFFWFFPAEEDYANAPVILWLQGGPGDSSMIGLLAENGPFKIGEDFLITQRYFRWTKKHSVIYIDSPAGAGYSFTDESGYATSQVQVADELYEALTQFFTLFPNLRKNDFFIAGESYAGKYVPSIANLIHIKNPYTQSKINLKGLAIDSGFSDPINQISYASYFHEHGLIDDDVASNITELQNTLTKQIKNRDWELGFETFANILGTFRNESGINNFYNYLKAYDIDSKVKFYIAPFIQRSDIRAAIHVGRNKFSDGGDTYVNLIPDFMQSVADKVSELLKHYRVLLHNGQTDIITPYPLLKNYLRNLKFDGAAEYKTASRKLWKVNGKLAGYVKVAGKLTEVLVRNSGHMIAYDQPKWSYDLITKFIKNEPIA